MVQADFARLSVRFRHPRGCPLACGYHAETSDYKGAVVVMSSEEMSAFVLAAQRVSGHGGRICGIAGESMSAVRRETGRETGECAGVCSLWSLKSGYGGENEEVGLLQLIQSTSRCLWPLAPSRPPPLTGS